MDRLLAGPHRTSLDAKSHDGRMRATARTLRQTARRAGGTFMAASPAAQARHDGSQCHGAVPAQVAGPRVLHDRNMEEFLDKTTRDASEEAAVMVALPMAMRAAVKKAAPKKAAAKKPAAKKAAAKKPAAKKAAVKKPAAKKAAPKKAAAKKPAAKKAAAKKPAAKKAAVKKPAAKKAAPKKAAAKKPAAKKPRKASPAPAPSAEPTP